MKTSPELNIAADGILLDKGKAVIKMCSGALRVFAPPVDAGAEKTPEEKAEVLPAPLSPHVGTDDNPKSR